MRRIISILLCVILCGCLVLSAAGCGKKEAQEGLPAGAAVSEPGMRKTVLYYQDDYGMLVPVMKSIPWEEGIGKAALNNLTNTSDNAASAGALGLKAVLPEDVEIALRIKNGEAQVNLKNLKKFDTAIEEYNAVCAIVNTMMEFSAVETVLVSVNGKSAKLPHGTDISRAFARIDLNAEAMSTEGEEQLYNKLVLYFPNYEGSLNIPVTRYLPEEPTMETAISELIKGPSEGSSLRNCFPDGTQLRSLVYKDGVVTIDLTKEFENVIESIGLEQKAMETLYLTCSAFGEVKEIKIKVEGKKFKSEADASAPAFANILQ